LLPVRCVPQAHGLTRAWPSGLRGLGVSPPIALTGPPAFDAKAVNQPTPAIVSQGAVRRLPRLALLLLCAAYVLPGLVGREPWRSADMASFGYMLEIARGHTGWFDPMLLGLRPEADGVLPYWLGAGAILAAPQWISPFAAARLPFFALLALALAATWYGVYHLARHKQAQPVQFAFGGEANPADYARAMADGGLLALIACLGLAQLSHEITTSVAQLGFAALSFYAVAALQYRMLWPTIALAFGLPGLALSGAPSLALYFGVGGTLLHLACPTAPADRPSNSVRACATIAAITLLVAVASGWFDLWRWRLVLPQDAGSNDWRTLGRLLLWFTWPAWPLALWTLWRWRLQLFGRPISMHLALPLWFIAGSLFATLTTKPADRALMLALPALATMAAFALPTLQRSVAALIDWFTLVFFTGCGLVIWVIWIGMQTGVPRQAQINVLRQAPGFEASFSPDVFLIALAATLVWAWLVMWRVGRHQSAIWKSLVLPAGGAAWCWLLLMTLWMPLLDFVRSYTVVVHNVSMVVGRSNCVYALDLSREQIAAFQYHANYRLHALSEAPACDWMLVNPAARAGLQNMATASQWRLQATVRKPSDKGDDVLLFKRVQP